MALVHAGSYVPFFGKGGSSGVEHRSVEVSSFWMDRAPVTRREFLAFVKADPEWRKSRVKRIFADTRYLEDWPSDSSFGSRIDANAPITHVSWFAARAYCEEQGKELPTVDQWEYAADDHGHGRADSEARILAWYGSPNPKRLPEAGKTPKNGFGISDLYGLVWEWTEDFNGAMANGGADSGFFCGAASIGAADPSDYAAFMRYSFRASLKANYTTGNLGFRCVKEVIE